MIITTTSNMMSYDGLQWSVSPDMTVHHIYRWSTVTNDGFCVDIHVDSIFLLVLWADLGLSVFSLVAYSCRPVATLCRQQRDFTARVVADAHKAQAALQQAQQHGGQIAVQSAALAQALEQEATINKQNSADILRLEQQLQEDTKQASEASKTLEKVSIQFLPCLLQAFHRNKFA